MFGKIIRVVDNYIYVENRMEKSETNLIGYHLVFSDTSKQLVGEIINISIKEIEVLLIGEIKDNIRKLSEDKGLGVLITDHNPKATLSITDRAYVIFDGKIKIQGKSADVAVDPVAKEFYLGKDFQL